MPIGLSPPRKKDPKHDDPKLRKADTVPPHRQARHVPLLWSCFFLRLLGQPPGSSVSPVPCPSADDSKSRDFTLSGCANRCARMCTTYPPCHFGTRRCAAESNRPCMFSAQCRLMMQLGFLRPSGCHPSQRDVQLMLRSMTASHLHLRMLSTCCNFGTSASKNLASDRENAKVV